VSLRRYLPLLFLLVVVLAACAAGPNAAVDVPNVDGETAGFWLGLWHGAISPVTLVISLFSDNVNVYEVHNTGNWYDVGFVVAIVSFVGGGCSAKR
jgi:hypothetical protein